MTTQRTYIRNRQWSVIAAAMILLMCTPHATAVDTDGDGLLDLLDVPGFDPNASGDVIFSSRGIQDLDGANQLTQAVRLYLSNNQITSIESGDFDGLANLQWLGLDDNMINGIDSGDFDGLTTLHWLDLTGNQIPSIDSEDFDGLDNLQSLNLSLNPITSIESGDFDGLANLRTLYLYHDQLTSIDQGDFDGLTNLEVLGLDGNMISSIDSGDFDGLANLRALWFGANQLTNIESGSFDGMTNLQSLIIHYNQLTSIESGLFNKLEGLELLELDNNEITELNLTGATFQRLFYHTQEWTGLLVDGDEIISLYLDDATLSLNSFDHIIQQAYSVIDVSLIGLAYSDENPGNLQNLFTISTLNHITVDPSLYGLYAAEFDAWNALDGKSLTIVEVVDLNRDGTVDAADAGLMFAEWGEAPYGWSLADFYDDGIVDAADAGALFELWTGDATTSIPEPSTGLLASLALLALLQRRRCVAMNLL